MSLFEAPGWDSGASSITSASSSTRKNNKRKRGAGATTDEDGPSPTQRSASVSTSNSQNLQKLMQKMKIEKNAKNSAMERLKPSESVQKFLKARKRAAPPIGGLPPILTSMEPPSTSSPQSADGTSSSFSWSQPPPSKKPRMRREESDVFPPSSAGDETDPSFVAEIKKKKRTKKSRRQTSDSTSAKPVITMLGGTETTSEADQDSGMETTRLGSTSTSIRNPSKASVDIETTSDEYAGLTKMQREMKQKLSGGRFRMINELLYKSESSSAHELMRDDPSTFHDYHVGFRNQVQSWPTNPVDYFTQSISSTHSAKSTVIVDLGCGDAALAKQLAKQGFKVLSFDLVSDGEWVTEADICDKIPLPGKEETDSAQIVDVCVCALSLMSTNWLRCVREARRILKMKGEFDIAEVTSRFPDINGFVALISSVGFELVKKTEPSSHFTIFKFRKVPLPKPLTRKDWASLETRSKELLTPCEYKRR